MRVRGKALGWLNDVLVDDPKRTESHPLRVIVIGERERVVGVEPAVIEVASLGGFADRYHNRNSITFSAEYTLYVAALENALTIFPMQGIIFIGIITSVTFSSLRMMS